MAIVLGGIRIIDINDEDLPVSLTLVDHCVGAEDLDLDNVTGLVRLATNLADINGIVVTKVTSVRVLVHGVFPGCTWSVRKERTREERGSEVL